MNRVAALEFSSERKTMSVVVKGYNGVSGNTVFLKGASDRVLDKCNSINLNGSTQPLTSADKEKLKAVMAE